MGCRYCHAVLLFGGLHLPMRRHLSKKTPVKMLQGLVLANSHVFSDLEDSEESPKGGFLHCCCCDVGSGISGDDYIYIYTYNTKK